MQPARRDTRPLFTLASVALSQHELTFLCRVRPEGPGEGRGDPSDAAGRVGGRLREPQPDELGPDGGARRGPAVGHLQSGSQPDPAGPEARLRAQTPALERHQEAE